MSEWKEYKLGDLIDVKHGYAFKGAYFSDEPTSDVVLTPGNFKIGGGFKGDKFKYYEGEYPEEYVLKEGDVIVTMTDLSQGGDTLGYSAKVPKPNGIRFLHNQRLGLVILKSPDADKEFIYWLLRTSDYHETIVNAATGSTVRHTSPTAIKEYRFELPPLPEQRAIASVLSSLDDKIDLLHRQNKTLEALAETLFRQWFVEEAEPQWPKAKLGEVADVNWGDTNVTKASYIAKGYIAYSATGPDGFLDYHDYDRTGIVVSAIGVNAGLTWYAQGKWSCIKNTIRFWSTSDEINDQFLYFYTKGVEKWPLRGSAQPFISQTDAREIEIVIPSKAKMEAFGQFAKPLFEKLGTNTVHIRALTQMRDTLLPKLMSREVRVKSEK